MRIIGGALGGRRLQAPAGLGTRPTADRVREAIFNILGPPPPQTRVLDAFAGAGGLGLEALSRGATHAEFIDNARPALRCLRANIQALDVADRTRVHTGDAPALLQRLEKTGATRFRWVFVDPPYQSELATRTLDVLGRGALLEADATVIVEHDRRNPPAISHGCLIRTGHRRYGDTEVSLYHPNRMTPQAPSSE